MMMVKTAIFMLILMVMQICPAVGEQTLQGPERNEPANVQAAEKHHAATIVEVITGKKYIYLNLEEGEGKIWIATLPSFLGGEVKAGDNVQYSGGIEMSDFKSKELDKTFDKILFITKIKKAEAPKLKDLGHVPADNYHYQFVTQATERNVSAPAKGEIEKADKGKNIEEIFAEAGKLKDTEVRLRARVMKVSKNILSKNWLTLQDGTGTPPDNKLTATTLESADAGDIVTIKGILKTDVDLGAGYYYKVILQEAVIIKQQEVRGE